MANRKTRSAANAVPTGAALYGAATGRQAAAAVNETVKDMAQFRRVATHLRRVPLEQRQGNLFEYLEAAKYNRNAALQGSPCRAHVNHANGAPHSPADIEIRRGTRIVRQVQAKLCRRPAHTTHQISNPKYRGMQKLVARDQAEQVRGLAGRRAATGTLKADDYTDTVQNVTGELHAEGVSSGGTSYEEAARAAKEPRLYAALTELNSVAREAAVTAGHAAAAGALVGGAISLVENALAVSRGEVSTRQAARNVARDGARAGGRGGATGGVTVVVRYGAAKAGLKVLAKANVAAAIVAGALDVTTVAFRFVRGEISVEDAAEQLGQNGASTLSGFYTGAVAGAAFGPAGVLVGSLVGYMVAAQVYQSCAAILRKGRLAVAASARALAVAEAACREMEQRRLEFAREAKAVLQEQRQQFSDCFSSIEASLAADDPTETARALAHLADIFGYTLPHSTFAEFDLFMVAEDAPLVL